MAGLGIGERIEKVDIKKALHAGLFYGLMSISDISDPCAADQRGAIIG